VTLVEFRHGYVVRRLSNGVPAVGSRPLPHFAFCVLPLNEVFSHSSTAASMKFTRAAGALALSGASIVTATTTSAGAPCTSTQISSAYLALASILTSYSLTDCSSDTGLSFLYTTVLPTDTQYTVMCALSSCHELVELVIEASPPNCVLEIPTSGLAINVYALANAFEATCDAILATEAPVTEVPVTPVPVTEGPVTDAPVILEPVTEDPATEDSITEDPATDIPTTEDPATDAPVTLVPLPEDPATEDPVTEDPATEESATEEPITDTPVTLVPLPEDPVTEEPSTEEPTTDTPVTEEPVTEDPVTEEPATEPVTDVPTTDVPVVTTGAPLCGW
jgi:hypothetical protein